MRRLDGKVALISGTADGQGRAAALRFAAEGALVVGGDLLHEQALGTQRLIAREGGTALTPGPLDVTDEQSVSSWVHEAVDAFGGIDTVCAGADRFGPVNSRPCKDFAFTMRAELDPVWLTVRSAWPHLRRSRGCILTIGSTAGLTGSLTNRTTAHSASRSAAVPSNPEHLCAKQETFSTPSAHHTGATTLVSYCAPQAKTAPHDHHLPVTASARKNSRSPHSLPPA